MKKGVIIIFLFSSFCFIATCLIYNYNISRYGIITSLGENQSTTPLFPGSPNILVIADDNQSSFWRPWRGTTLTDDSNIKISGLNSLMIDVGVRSYGGLFECRFESTQNWSDKDFFTFYLYGQKSGYMFRIHILTPDWDNRCYLDFYDNFKGWRKLILSLHEPTGTVGNYDLSKVKGIIWVIPNVQVTGTWHLDRVAVEEETIWLTLLAKFEENLEILIYSSATTLVLSGIIIRKIRGSYIPLEPKIHLKDFTLYTVIGSIPGFLVWFILEDTGWLAYMTSLMTTILTIKIYFLSRKEAKE